MDIKKILKGFAEITYTPVTIFTKLNNGFTARSYPDVPYLKTLCEKYPKQLLETSNTAWTYVLEEFLFYGYVKISDEQFAIVGPIIEMPLNNNTAGIILKNMGLPHADIKELLEYYEQTPHYSIYRFAKMVCVLNEWINDNGLHTRDLMPTFFQQNVEPHANNNAGDAQSVKSENYERTLYGYIYAGQYQLLKDFLNKNSYEGPIAQISQTSIRQYKYLVIISIAIASRTAYMAGINYNASLIQSDAFMRKADNATTYNELFDLHRQMLLYYAKLVADYRLGAPASALLVKVQNYVGAHVYEKITTSEIAAALNMNRTYLSMQFKEDTGINLADYINMVKIDEAKRLLATTDKTLIEIANALSFSSQSYFNEVFKKFAGVMPKKFRETSIFETVGKSSNTDFDE